MNGRHLGFCLQIISSLLESCCIKVSLSSKFGADWCSGLEVTAIFSKFKMADGRHLRIFSHHFWSHRKVAVHQVSLASKFGEDRWNGLEVRVIFRNSRQLFGGGVAPKQKFEVFPNALLFAQMRLV